MINYCQEMLESKEKILIISNKNYIFNIVKQYFKEYNVILQDIANDKNDFILTVEDYNAQSIKIYNSLYDSYDNIPKPFRANDLINKLQKILNIISNIKNIGNLVYNNISMTLKNNIDNNYIELTKIENDILSFILANSAVMVSKYDILSRVLRYSNDVDTHTVENHIYRLRQKISGITDENIIQTDKSGKYYINID